MPVACTRFCELPGVPTVGGTKNPDVAAIVALAPDLVVVNDEENRWQDATALIDAGLAVHSMSPRSVHDVGAEVRALADAARAAGARAVRRRRLGRVDRVGALAALVRRVRRGVAASVDVAGGDTYGSSLLDLLGVNNVFADSLERYPEVTLARGRGPGPEPDPPAERALRVRSRARGARSSREVTGVPIVFVDGRDLFWWGDPHPGRRRPPRRARCVRDHTACGSRTHRLGGGVGRRIGRGVASCARVAQGGSGRAAFRPISML